MLRLERPGADALPRGPAGLLARAFCPSDLPDHSSHVRPRTPNSGTLPNALMAPRRYRHQVPTNTPPQTPASARVSAAAITQRARILAAPNPMFTKPGSLAGLF